MWRDCYTSLSVRVAIYARVSREDQRAENQVRELEEFARRRGFEISGIYIDQGISGAKEIRPSLSSLMSAARHREFDAVLVWKIDRFARSLKHLGL